MVPSSVMQQEYRRQLNRINSNHGSKIPVVEGDNFINEGIDTVFENYAVKFQTNSFISNALRQLEVKKQKLDFKKFDKDAVFAIYPKDLYMLTNQYVIACKDGCDVEKNLDLYIVQSSDINQALKDPSWVPSFAWEQTIAEQSGDALIVYHNCDFDVKEVVIDFLKKPNHIATPSLLENGKIYKRNGETISKDVNFEVDSTFLWRKAIEVAVLNTCSALGDNMDYNRELNRIMTIDKIYIN